MMLSVCGYLPQTAEAAYDRNDYYKMSIAEYSNYDYSDPQYITDEDFFGKWDENSQTWVKTPYFVYGTELEDVTDAGQKLLDMAVNMEALSKVENAAKQGNYALCKEELLHYYQKKHKGYNMDYTPSDTLYESERIKYETMLDNLRCSTYPVAKFHVYDEEYIEISADVSNTLKVLVSNGNAISSLKFVFGAGRKDGYRVEIDTQEFEPYVEARVNGEKQIYPLTSCLNLDASEPDTPHPNPDTLCVEESVTSIGLPETVDEHTKRCMMQFDVPGLTSNWQVTGATLRFRARKVKDDIDVESPLMQTSWKSVYIYPWSKNPTIDINTTFNEHLEEGPAFYSFSGEPGHRDYIASPSATKVTATGFMGFLNPDLYPAIYYNETFAYHTIRSILNSIINRGDYETFAGNFNKINNYSALIIVSFVFNGVRYLHHYMESEYMTPEAFTMILKFIYFLGRWTEETWEDAFDQVNHGSYSVRALEWLCFLYPEFRDVYGPLLKDEDGDLILSNEKYKGSVQGGWLEVANFRRAYKQGKDINEDGSSIEASTEYATEGYSGYLSAIDIGELLNLDTSFCYQTEYSEEANARLQKGLEYITTLLNPAFGTFQIGDDAAYTTNFANVLKPYTKIIDSPFVNYIVTDRKEGEEPPKSIVYDDSKEAVFRNSWATDYAVAGRFSSRGGGSHSHNDDLSLTLYAYGNYLLIDPRMGTYEEEIPSDRWVSSTRGHNTIEIDNAVARGDKVYAYQMEPQIFAKNSDGSVKIGDEGVPMQDDPLIVPINQLDLRPGNLFEENREINNVYDFIKGSSLGYTGNNAEVLENENFQLERDVLFLRNGYFVVTDYCKPQYSEQNGKVHLYKQLWHFLPEANMSIDYENNVIRTNFTDKANVLVATVDDGNIEPTWRYGLYARSRSAFDIAKYGFFKQEKQGAMKFNTLIYPVPYTEDAEITTKNIDIEQPEDKASAFYAEVKNTTTNVVNEISYYTLRDNSLKKEISFGKFSTDGVLALAERMSGQNVNLVLRGGSFIRDYKTDEYVIYSDEELVDIGVYWQNDEIDIAYNEEDSYNNEVDLTKLTIMTNGAVNKVRLNEKEIEFKQQGKYIYFGEEPLIEDETVFPGEDEGSSGNSSSKPSHGTGGGSGGGGSSSEKDVESDKVDSDIKPEIPVVTPTVKYPDIETHWAKNEINDLSEKGVISGYEDGTFKPDNSITRAEFLALATRLIDSEERADIDFNDVVSSDWYYDVVRKGVALGIISKDTSFRPDDLISREEMCKIVSGVSDKLGILEEDSGPIYFEDKDDISLWAESYVAKMTASGIIKGNDRGEFLPKGKTTRAEAAAVIYRILIANAD